MYVGQIVIEQFFISTDISQELLILLEVRLHSLDFPQTLNIFPLLVFPELLNITPHLSAVSTGTLHHLHMMNTHKL